MILPMLALTAAFVAAISLGCAIQSNRALRKQVSVLEQRIGELKVDQQEKREIIEGLLQVLQDQSPPPSRGLFGWLLGR